VRGKNQTDFAYGVDDDIFQKKEKEGTHFAFISLFTCSNSLFKASLRAI